MLVLYRTDTGDAVKLANAYLMFTRMLGPELSDGTLHSVRRAVIDVEANCLLVIRSAAASNRGPTAAHRFSKSVRFCANSAFHSSLISPPCTVEHSESSFSL